MDGHHQTFLLFMRSESNHIATTSITSHVHQQTVSERGRLPNVFVLLINVYIIHLYSIYTCHVNHKMTD